MDSTQIPDADKILGSMMQALKVPDALAQNPNTNVPVVTEATDMRPRPQTAPVTQESPKPLTPTVAPVVQTQGQAAANQAKPLIDVPNFEDPPLEGEAPITEPVERILILQIYLNSQERMQVRKQKTILKFYVIKQLKIEKL